MLTPASRAYQAQARTGALGMIKFRELDSNQREPGSRPGVGCRHPSRSKIKTRPRRLLRVPGQVPRSLAGRREGGEVFCEPPPGVEPGHPIYRTGAASQRAAA